MMAKHIGLNFLRVEYCKTGGVLSGQQLTRITHLTT